MASLPPLEFAVRTDTGRVRPHNEDAIALSPDFGLLVLADGMGGYNAGEVASSIATSIVPQVIESRLRLLAAAPSDSAPEDFGDLLIDAVSYANLAILDAAFDEPAYAGMGTTLVVALFQRGQLTLAHVGDSRCYRFRDEVLEQLTRDHSQLQDQIDAGLISPELAQFAENRNLITRAVGIDDALEVEVHTYPIAPDDVYLLCSDGLSDMLTAQQISDILHASGHSLQEAADNLVTSANDYGGSDNISVMLVRVQAMGTDKGGLIERILNWIT
ncbi:Stp1/IreP family PP2C-type Ser/Thr phosphatase [Actimicrobium antarcticum]